MPRVQQFGQQHDTRQRADHRFQALQHAHRARRQPAQCSEVERVGEHRRQDGDREPHGQHGRPQQVGARCPDPERERDDGRPRHGEGEGAGVGAPRAPAEQEVPAHRDARREREQHAVHRQRPAAVVDQEHPRGGEERPRRVQGAAGPGQCDRERTDELQRRRHAEREVPQRGVDEVHPRDRGAEGDDEAERAGVGGRARAQDGEQDERREPEPQRDDAGRLQQVERPLPDGLPDLDAHHAGEAEERGAGHAPTFRRRFVNVQLRFPAAFLVESPE
ncbi:hypothetical protein GCM10023320_77120 [Pseudonocardia adelaidensis]|uniref:Uncharacterized protein n=1 Tax=Pseudonocardia adelaidensis TaxID=648754 RepID=A0ABP9P489_9PSEU